ncbi:hypothetical protein ABZ942_01180 [Nocardia sp. NPDC046473]|uniref:hypothetical protein n=1 Tax=Nocardia sp. NPDC046473 TaxID=3155733 RepID=UPI00340C9302
MGELVRVGEAFQRHFRRTVEEAGGRKPDLRICSTRRVEAELKPVRVVAGQKHGDDAEQF